MSEGAWTAWLIPVYRNVHVVLVALVFMLRLRCEKDDMYHVWSVDVGSNSNVNCSNMYGACACVCKHKRREGN